MDQEKQNLVAEQEREAAQEWLHENGNNVASIEQKLKLESDRHYPEQALHITRKSRRQDDGALEVFCGWVIRHQIGLAVNLLMLLALTHLCFPRARRHTRKFFELSYLNSETGQYRAGWNDIWMVSYWIVVFTGLRAAVMDYILMPIGKKAGIKSPRDETRFAEQAWLITYYLVFWPIGMYIFITSDYWLNLRNLWTNWPTREIGGLPKFYILVQYAFWLQQIMVINMEKRRKDHWQMLTHHVVTVILIFTSYGYHQTKVANLILCLMDVVDIFFSAAKCSKYLGYRTLPDILFGVFLFSWIICRHVFYVIVCYSVWKHIPQVINMGCYRGANNALIGPFPKPDQFGHLLDPFRDPEGVVCFDEGIKWGFLGALLFLQAIQIMWFFMIMRVAIQVLRGAAADDVRSDDEDEEEEEDEVDAEIIATIEELDDSPPPPYEEEVGVEQINLKGRTSKSRSLRKSNSSSSGISLPHSDRKELLGRIGCDKGV